METRLEVEYITDKDGRPKAAVIPIAVWRKILPQENASIEDISEEMENYCLNKAMDEAEETTLMDREAALEYLMESSE